MSRPVDVTGAGYRGGMTRQGTPEGTPPKDEVESDFTVPDDADLRPVAEAGDGDES